MTMLATSRVSALAPHRLDFHLGRRVIVAKLKYDGLWRANLKMLKRPLAGCNADAEMLEFCLGFLS